MTWYYLATLGSLGLLCIVAINAIGSDPNR